MLVYEHEQFVAKAIESVLAQKCDFPLELIITNDASSDRSDQICQRYADEHQDVIKYINNSSNIGMHESFAILWRTCSADLVAFCEGDDYWVDEDKLQKQVNLLEENPHWNLCGGKAQVIEKVTNNEWAVTHHVCPRLEKSEYCFEEMISSYSFHFSTVVLKKSSVTFPDWFKSVYCVDRPIYLLAVENATAGYLSDVVSSYRIHESGNWSSLSSLRRAEQSTDLFTKLKKHFGNKYRRVFEVTLFDILQSYAAIEMLEGRHTAARKIFWSAFDGLGIRSWLRCLKKHYRTAILLLIKR